MWNFRGIITFFCGDELFVPSHAVKWRNILCRQFAAASVYLHVDSVSGDSLFAI